MADPFADTVVTPDLIDRQIHQESRGDPNAVGPYNPKYGSAKGLAQVIDSTAQQPGHGIDPLPLGAAGQFNAEKSRRFMEQSMVAYTNKYGSVRHALMAYNWGEGNVDNWIKAGQPAEKIPLETRNYLLGILGSGHRDPAGPDAAHPAVSAEAQVDPTDPFAQFADTAAAQAWRESATPPPNPPPPYSDPGPDNYLPADALPSDILHQSTVPGRIMAAIGNNVADGLRLTEPLGLDPESRKAWEDSGLIAPLEGPRSHLLLPNLWRVGIGTAYSIFDLVGRGIMASANATGALLGQAYTEATGDAETGGQIMALPTTAVEALMDPGLQATMMSVPEIGPALGEIRPLAKLFFGKVIPKPIINATKILKANTTRLLTGKAPEVPTGTVPVMVDGARVPKDPNQFPKAREDKPGQPPAEPALPTGVTPRADAKFEDLDAADATPDKASPAITPDGNAADKAPVPQSVDVVDTRHLPGESKVIEPGAMSADNVDVYHGTQAVFDKFDTQRANTESLFGPGIYTTEDPGIASDYATGKKPYDASTRVTDIDTLSKYYNPGSVVEEHDGLFKVLKFEKIGDYDWRAQLQPMTDAETIDTARKAIWRSEAPKLSAVDEALGVATSAPHVRPMKITLNRAWDLDAPLPQGVRDWLATNDPEIAAMMKEGATGVDLAKAYRDNNYSLGHELQFAAKANGYDGFTHMGGAVTGGRPHRVWIAFDNSQVRGRFETPGVKAATGSIPAPANAKAQRELSEAELSRFGFSSQEIANGIPTRQLAQAQQGFMFSASAEGSEWVPATPAVVTKNTKFWKEEIAKDEAATAEWQQKYADKEDGEIIPGIHEGDPARPKAQTEALMARRIGMAQNQIMAGERAGKRWAATQEAMTPTPLPANLGDLPPPPKPATEGKPAEPVATPARPAQVTPLDEQGRPNLHFIESEEQVDELLHAFAEHHGGPDAHTPGTATLADTRETAKALGLTEEEYAKRRIDSAYSAHELFGLRLILVKSARMIKEQMAKIVAGNRTDADLLRLEELVNRHTMIQRGAAGKSNEGRALGILSDIAGKDADQAKLAKALEEGGREKLVQLAEEGNKTKTPEELSRATENLQRPGASDKIFEAYINARMFSIRTQVRNLIGNVTAMLMAGIEAPITIGTHKAMRAAGLAKDAEQLYWSELAPGFQATFSGGWIGLKAAWERLKTDRPSGPYSKFEVKYPKAIYGWKGNVVRASGRLLGATDEVFRSIATHQSLTVQAWREATTKGLTGAKRDAYVTDRIVNPTDEMRKKAEQQGAYRTFTIAAGRRTADFQKTINQLPTGRYFTLFMRINSNMARYGGERIPLNFIASPVMRKTFKQDFGSERAAQAASRMIVGSTILGLSAVAAANGLLPGTGPSDKTKFGQRYSHGFFSNAALLGGWFVDTTFMGPVSTLMTLSADAYQMSQIMTGDNEEGHNKLDEAVKLLVASAANLYVNQGFLGNTMDLFDVMADPQDSKVNAFVGRFLAGYVPTGVGQIAAYNDPYQRHASSLLDQLRLVIPGLREQVDVRISPLTGEPLPATEYLGPDIVSPVKIRERNMDPVELSLEKIGIFPAPVKQTLWGVKLDRDQYEEYAQKAGRMQYQLFRDVGVGTPAFDAQETKVKQMVVMKLQTMARTAMAKDLFANHQDLMLKKGLAMGDMGLDQPLEDMP